jgi:large subunit ribosomal protein L6
MSRVGRKVISIPKGVKVSFNEGVLAAEGKCGKGTHLVSPKVEIKIEDDCIRVKSIAEDKAGRAMWGTERALISNLIHGVSESFQKNLEIVGLGYKAQAVSGGIKLSLGFSHDIEHHSSGDVSLKVPAATRIIIEGIQKQAVGQVASKIRSLRPPELFKGKGLLYAGEKILLKEKKKK